MSLNRWWIVFCLILCGVAGATIQWEFHPRILYPLLAAAITWGVAEWKFPQWGWRGEWLWGFVVLGGVLFSLNLWSISVSPPMHVVDEPWVLSYMIGWERYGCVTDTIMLRLQGCGPGYSAIYALGGEWLGWFGQSFSVARIFFALFLIPQTLFTALSAYRLYGSLAGAMAFLLALVGGMANAMMEVRYNAPTALLWAICIWLFIEAQSQQRKGLHFWAGLWMGVNVAINQRMAFLGVGTALAFYLPQMLQQSRWKPPLEFWLFALGGLLGATPEVVDILLHLDSFLLHVQNDTSTQIFTVLTAIGLHIIYGLIYNPVEFFALALAVGVGLRSKHNNPHTVSLIILLGISYLIFGFIGSGGWFYLARPLWPLAVLVMARLWDTKQRPVQQRQLLGAWIVTATLIGNTVAEPIRYATGNLQPIWASSPAYAWLRQNTTPDEPILAPSTYYAYLPEWEFTSIYVATLANFELNLDIPEVDLWAQANPTWIVLDSREGDYLNPPSLLQYIQDEGYTLQQTFTTGEVDKIDIYRRIDAPDAL